MAAQVVPREVSDVDPRSLLPGYRVTPPYDVSRLHHAADSSMFLTHIVVGCGLWLWDHIRSSSGSLLSKGVCEVLLAGGRLAAVLAVSGDSSPVDVDRPGEVAGTELWSLADPGAPQERAARARRCQRAPDPSLCQLGNTDTNGTHVYGIGDTFMRARIRAIAKD